MLCKLLTDETGREALCRALTAGDVFGPRESVEWLEEELLRCGSREGIYYVNLGARRALRWYAPLGVGESIRFDDEGNNTEDYVRYGLSMREERYMWTEGGELSLRFHMSDWRENEDRVLELRYCGVFGDSQRVEVLRDGETICRGAVLPPTEESGVLRIPLDASAGEQVHLILRFPTAASPRAAGVGSDPRLLALQIESMTLRAAQD